MADLFRRYLLPGLVFESAVIAGGYATGRELVEFFLPAGPWGGLLGMMVGMLAMMGYYDEIGAVALPSAFLLARLQAPWFEWAFQIAVLLTLVDTGVAMLHAINERVAAVYEERRQPMPRVLRPALAVAVMVVSVYAASAVGLVELIAKGYGLLTYAFIVLLILCSPSVYGNVAISSRVRPRRERSEPCCGRSSSARVRPDP